jgi:hypothetical protein
MTKTVFSLQFVLTNEPLQLGICDLVQRLLTYLPSTCKTFAASYESQIWQWCGTLWGHMWQNLYLSNKFFTKRKQNSNTNRFLKLQLYAISKHFYSDTLNTHTHTHTHTQFNNTVSNAYRMLSPFTNAQYIIAYAIQSTLILLLARGNIKYKKKK